MLFEHHYKNELGKLVHRQDFALNKDNTKINSVFVSIFQEGRLNVSEPLQASTSSQL